MIQYCDWPSLNGTYDCFILAAVVIIIVVESQSVIVPSCVTNNNIIIHCFLRQCTCNSLYM